MISANFGSFRRLQSLVCDAHPPWWQGDLMFPLCQPAPARHIAKTWLARRAFVCLRAVGLKVSQTLIIEAWRLSALGARRAFGAIGFVETAPRLNASRRSVASAAGTNPGDFGRFRRCRNPAQSRLAGVPAIPPKRPPCLACRREFRSFGR